MPSRLAYAKRPSSDYESGLGLVGVPLGFVPNAPSFQDTVSSGYYEAAGPLFETGWILDYEAGGIRYVSTGRVEEVDEDGNPFEPYDERENIPCPPAPRLNAWEVSPWEFSPHRLSRRDSMITLVDYPDACPAYRAKNAITNGEEDEDSSVFASQQKMFPANRPRRRSSTASFAGARHHTKPYPAQSPRLPLTPKNMGAKSYFAQHTTPSDTISQDVQYAILQVQFLAFHFQSHASEFDVNEYIFQTCEGIAQMLHKLDEILRNESQQNQPHIKSLQRTIKRLTSVVEHRPSSWSHCKKMLDKLCEHQAKLSSLLKKLSAC